MRTTQREVLVATAERLFAERGIDAVSLRTVMAEAGTNVAAVNYHFGSKDALVAAVVRARSVEIRAAREHLLTAVEAPFDGGSAPTVRDLARAFVQPLADMAAAGDTPWIRLVADVTSSGHPAVAVMDEEFAEQSARVGVLLRRLRPGLDQVAVRFRLTVAMTLAYRTLGDLDDLRTRVAAPGGPPVHVERLVAEVVDAVAAVLGGNA